MGGGVNGVGERILEYMPENLSNWIVVRPLCARSGHRSSGETHRELAGPQSRAVT